jgi:hypothetical protein
MWVKVLKNLYNTLEIFVEDVFIKMSNSPYCKKEGWVKIGGYGLSEIAIKNFRYGNGHIGK